MFSVKHYLGCIALALCLAGSAYATNKGGNLGTRAMARIKAGVESRLFSDGKLAPKLANSKLGRTAVAGLLGITIACSGCGNGDGLVTPTETEVVEVTEITEVTEVTKVYDGDIIYFKQGGIIYEGRVVEGVSADEVLVSLADGSEMVIAVDRIAGKRIAAHPDLGVQVVMLGDRDQGEKLLVGRIAGVYTDGVRKIKFVTADFVDGRFEKLDVPRIRLVHENKDFEDGGYLTLEEFFRIENGLN